MASVWWPASASSRSKGPSKTSRCTSNRLVPPTLSLSMRQCREHQCRGVLPGADQTCELGLVPPVKHLPGELPIGSRAGRRWIEDRDRFSGDRSIWESNRPVNDGMEYFVEIGRASCRERV